ncbi:hypothetical protein [Desulfobulbus propionicus]|jgi:hypothetical protein|uniref:hypothetical protein n=1 Tax=Desulfobulbus propionicus TaxID=894 RepID=UPI0005C1964D|nr:hypothetical protein [Desulfobulbus propionicus]
MDLVRKLLKGKNLSQDDLIPILILAIGSMGNKVLKSEVDGKMYELLKKEFSDPVYHEKVANNVPRWKHDVAWAKERAKQHHGYVKSAEQSGRGIWELTSEGMEYLEYLKKKLQRTFVTRKNQIVE